MHELDDADEFDVAAIRAAKSWSAIDLAKYLGCNPSTVWRMEHGGKISGPMRKLLLLLKLDVQTKRRLSALSNAKDDCP